MLPLTERSPILNCLPSWTGTDHDQPELLLLLGLPLRVAGDQLDLGLADDDILVPVVHVELLEVLRILAPVLLAPDRLLAEHPDQRLLLRLLEGAAQLPAGEDLVPLETDGADLDLGAFVDLEGHFPLVRARFGDHRVDEGARVPFLGVDVLDGLLEALELGRLQRHVALDRHVVGVELLLDRRGGQLLVALEERTRSPSGAHVP